MSNLQQKHILLGITGGIAAYKAAELVRRLKDGGAEVHVVMTEGALNFITPLTLQALSGNPVHTTLLDPAAEAAMGHIELAKWADLVLIAPASADIMAKLACGMANDLLTTLCLATNAPLALAPAMNQAMWSHPQTQNNIAHLKQQGAVIFGPASGSQACGDVGFGRMLEAIDIAAACEQCFIKPYLQGKHVVITAGPTREALDPVRFISNHSSGKMGFALAEAAQKAGAKVTLIAGPVSLNTPYGIERINVESAEQMLAASEKACENAELFIASAAVADYRPAQVSEQKIKKTEQGDLSSIALVKNPDIVQTIAAKTEQRPFVVGFAAETQDVQAYAKDKLARKNLDLIIANNVAELGIGFNSDENAVTVISKQGTVTDISRCSKIQLASQLISIIAQQIEGRAQ